MFNLRGCISLGLVCGISLCYTGFRGKRQVELTSHGGRILRPGNYHLCLDFWDLVPLVRASFEVLWECRSSVAFGILASRMCGAFGILGKSNIVDFQLQSSKVFLCKVFEDDKKSIRISLSVKVPLFP